MYDGPRPTEQGRKGARERGREGGREGARERGREGCVDGYTGCMNGRKHGCMDYPHCQIG